jgi:hypothetical protein
MMLASLLGLVLLCQTPSDDELPPSEEQESPRYGISADFDWSFSNAEKSPLNLTYYGNNIMKLLRVSLLFNFRASDRIGLYVNLTSENLGTPHLYGAFVRLAPLGNKKLWIQAGKIPQPFGAFPERWYPFANPLIGDPFMYSYVTSLRPDNIPAGPDDLLSQRGNGLSPLFRGGGSTSQHPGISMIEIFKWAAGGVGFGRAGRFEYLAGVTSGTLSNPGGVDEGDGAQVLGRVRFLPSSAFNVGASAARGRWLDDIVEDSLDEPLDSYYQTGVGGDFHYARGHLLLYGEAAWSRWDLPNIDEPIDAISAFLETRYRWLPGLFAAGRLDRLSFSEITASNGESAPWEFPLTRLEVGAGFSWERHVILKLVGQFNWYDEATDLDENIIAFQIVVHF